MFDKRSALLLASVALAAALPAQKPAASPSPTPVKALAPLDEYRLLLEDLANVDTSGYKAHMGYPENRCLDQAIFSQGAFLYTGNGLDLAVSGEGFFEFIDADGSPFFSRDGEMKIDVRARLVNAVGETLRWDPSGDFAALLGRAQVRDLRASPGGEVWATVDGKPLSLGMIPLFPIHLDDVRDSRGGRIRLKAGIEAEPLPAGASAGDMRSGYLEMSTVNIPSTIARALYVIDGIDAKLIRNKDIKRKLLEGLLDRALDLPARVALEAEVGLILDRLEAMSPEAEGPPAGSSHLRAALAQRFAWIASLLPFLQPEY